MGRSLKRTKLTVAAMLMAAVASTHAGPVTTIKSLGSAKAPIRFQVFTDFACPACAAFHLETLRPLLAEYVASGKVHLTFYVLSSRERLPAYRAACYGNAAARCGRFEEVAESLYRNQRKWILTGDVDDAVAEVLAPQDLDKVRKELRNKIDAPLEADLATARAYQIRNTPTTIISGGGKSVPVVGAVSYPILKLYLDRLLRDME